MGHVEDRWHKTTDDGVKGRTDRYGTGLRWRARYRDPRNKEHAKHFDRKIDAERWLTEQESRINRGEWVDPALGRMTVEAWAPTWLASKRSLRPRTFRNYEELWRSLVRPRWGDVPLSAVTYAEVVVWQAELNNRGMSPARVTQALLVLKQLLDLAVKDGRLARNVAVGVKPPRPRKAEQRFLSHEQLAELAAECGRAHAAYKTFVLLLGYTGLRWGEVRALRVRRLDLLRARLEVSENIPHHCDERERSTPKSHKRRIVPIPRFLVDDLAVVVAGKKPDDLVFTSTSGGLLDASNFRRRVFDPAVSALGLAPFTPHNLRDTAASLAISAGANVKAVQRMLGHASAAMTLDVYAGLFSDDLDAVAERLNDAVKRAARVSTHNAVAPVVDLVPTPTIEAAAD